MTGTGLYGPQRRTKASTTISSITCWALKLLYSEFERRAAGATVKNLNIDLVRAVKIALPPLPEQRRIAEILDKVDALRAKRRIALARLDTLTQSIFLDMFGDPIANPRNLPVRHMIELVDVARPISYGILKPGLGQSDGVQLRARGRHASGRDRVVRYPKDNRGYFARFSTLTAEAG